MKALNIYTSVTFIVLCFFSKAQNLVPNYSFEQIIQCTTGAGEFNGYIANWTGQVNEGWLSYFTHQCSGDSSGGGSVPYNYYEGFQYAHTGVSYASVVTFANGTDSTYPKSDPMYVDQRVYLQAALTDSLIFGKKYFVTFYVSLMNSCDYACNDIGAYFSQTAPSFNTNGKVLPYTPQVANNPMQQELSDTLNWMKVSGKFIAKGGEKYITIGNFKNDSMSSLNYLGEITAIGTLAWYYVDDVIVSADSNYADSLFSSVQNVNAPKNEAQVYPNPSSTVLNIVFSTPQQQTEYLCLYNAIGQQVECIELRHNQTIMSVAGLPSGIYLYRILDANEALVQSGKVMVAQ